MVKPLVGARSRRPRRRRRAAAAARVSRRGLAIACGTNPRLRPDRPLPPWRARSIDEALRNAVAVGGDPEHTAILDNFSWGNCDKPDRLGALVLAAKGCYDAAVAYGTPFVSGKDSLNNEYRVGDRDALDPPHALLITALARVPDVAARA